MEVPWGVELPDDSHSTDSLLRKLQLCITVPTRPVWTLTPAQTGRDCLLYVVPDVLGCA